MDHRKYLQGLTGPELDDLKSTLAQEDWNRDSEERIGKEVVTQGRMGKRVTPGNVVRALQKGPGEYRQAAGMRAEENLTGRKPTDAEMDDPKHKQFSGR